MKVTCFTGHMLYRSHDLQVTVSTLGQDLCVYQFLQGVAIVTARSIKVSAGKPVLGGHLKLDTIKVLKTCGSLIQVESIAECIT